MNPLISIIILNCNGMRFLATCLNSLRKQIYKNFEIILIDNGSTDGSVEFVKSNFSEIKIIENKENFGFAKANNQGLEIARGGYIATLNNDTIVDENWLKGLIEATEKDKGVGMVASKILLTEEGNKLDSVGVNIALDGMTRQRGRMEQDIGQYEKKEEILFPSACAALYSKKMIEEIGFFDEDFFAYCEDSDLGLRGRLAGWKAVYSPKAVVRHLYSQTGGRYSSFKAYLVERNHFWLAIKNFPVELLLLFPFFTAHRFILQFYAALIKKGATSEFLSQYSFLDTIAIVFKAYFNAFKKLPKFIKKRRIIQKDKKLSRSGFYLLLKKHKLTFRELVFKK